MPRVFPIYLFTGDDDYLKREAVRKLKKALLHGGSEAFNFNVYDIGKCSITDVIDTLRSTLFISGKRLVLLKNIEAATPDEQQAIAEYARSPLESTCLVLESSERELSGDFYKEMQGYAREISFMSPKGNRISGWIRKEVRARGKTIRYDAAHLLKELKKDDIDSLRCEIEKLIDYVGKHPIISKEDVKEIIGSSASRSVFEFVHALSRKDAKEALTVARDLVRARKAISEILGMIGWQFRRIKKARDLLKKGLSSEDASIKCDVPPFYIERFMAEIKSFTAKELDRNIDYLLDADYSIKRGYAKPQDALELLIVKICKGN